MNCSLSTSLLTACLVVMVWFTQQPLDAQEWTSGVYVTAAGATMEECGDRLAPGPACDGFPNLPGRQLPFSATITLDLDGVEPEMSATMHNAVFEGGDPFELQLSSVGQSNADGYRFAGDYFQPGYFFDWQFSTSITGDRLLSGDAYWSGGHFWLLTFDDVPLLLVPEAGVSAWIIYLVAFLVGRVSRLAPVTRGS